MDVEELCISSYLSHPIYKGAPTAGADGIVCQPCHVTIHEAPV